MGHLSRRGFLRNSVGVGTGAALGSSLFSVLPASVLGANERVNMGWIGCGGRGRIVAHNLIDSGARITQICDLHEGRLESAAKEVESVQGTRPDKVKLIAKVLENKDIDAVLITTPDHWHGPASIMACQAGKDVYVEKPHAHNIWEGRKMIDASRKYKRVLQVGTQNRSAPYNQAARDYVKSGKLGKICLVKVYNLKSGGPFSLGDPGTPPGGFDWDRWLGPAPERPYHQRIFGGGWHKFWDYSGGDMADDGIHQLDLAMMLMGNPDPPTSVSCTGGRLAYPDDDSEVPDVQVVAYDFGKFVMTFELSEYPRYMMKTTATIRRNDEFPYWTQNSTRIELYGSDLMMTIGRHGGGWIVTTSGGRIVDKMYGRVPDAYHTVNFIECVKSRKAPNADVAVLHNSCCLVHLGNIANRLGNETLRWNGKAEKFTGKDADAANAMIKRQYRARYAVPDTV